ncbi:MAG TPA: hypothetical protein VIH42_13410, partial [Thermoguttaceae bacterium]
MIRSWLAVALLAGSWMFGVDYFYPANPLIWAIMVICAVVLLRGSMPQLPSGKEAMIALMLLLPALFFSPWPLKILPLLLALGLLLSLLPVPAHIIKSLAQGAMCAGVVMTAQSLI